jgi:methylase of polypeptide subunit release factors
VRVRRIPSHLPAAVLALLRWLDDADMPPLAADLVPGADETERVRLAALGALAHVLAPEAVASWPEPLALWAEAAAGLDASAIEREALLRGDTVDLLALTYEWVVSGTHRRRLGTFFTPDPLVRHMVDTASALIPSGPKAVADPGAGVGAFTLAARRRWPTAVVSAVDVNTVTLGLLAARLHADAEVNDRVRLVASDYLAWLADDWPTQPGPRLILGNPPYTRHQHLTAKEKQQARQAAGDLITSGLAGLSAYFLGASLLALDDDDALCLLLPGSWCETRYGRETREWLWKQRRRRVTVELFPSEVEVFPGTQVTAMVLTVGPVRDRQQPFEVREAELGKSHVRVTRTVVCDRNQVCPTTYTALLREPHRPPSGAKPLGDFATIRRGVATGASDFFFVSDADRREHNLPPAALRRALVRPRHTTHVHLTEAEHDAIGRAGHPRWLLDLNDTDLATSNPAVAAYLALGKQRDLHLRHLIGTRAHWYAVESVDPPDVFLAPVGSDQHRVIVNSVGAVGSNNFYGIYLNEDAPWTATTLAQWMRSQDGQAALASLARHYQGGSLKIEPRALRDLMVPPKPDRGR